MYLTGSGITIIISMLPVAIALNPGRRVQDRGPSNIPIQRIEYPAGYGNRVSVGIQSQVIVGSG